MRFKFYTSKIVIGYFEGSKCFMAQHEIDENNNRIESISPNTLDEKNMDIQLTQEPKVILKDKRYGDIWIGQKIDCPSNEYEILWPKLNDNEKLATELAEVFDGFVRAM